MKAHYSLSEALQILPDILPILAPFLLLELILVIVALVHIFRHKHYRVGNRWLWVVIVVFIQLIGPIAYFLIGRGEDE